MSNLSSMQVAQIDAEEIYIGNIFTIEADLKLPEKGKNGSLITWNSDKPHIIANDGKVTRPREGMGSCEVTLTATINYDGESVFRVFNATVLALKPESKISGVKTVEIELIKGNILKLPSVVIVEKDSGTYSTKPVTWINVPNFASLDEGEYEIYGEKLPDSDITPTGIVTIKANSESESKVEFKRTADIPVIIAQKINYGDIKITGGFFNENRIRAEEFLISCDLGSMLYNFREAAGLDVKDALPMSGWDAPECLLKGHTTGHYLSAVALAYAGNTENRERFGEIILYMIDGLAECQDAMKKSGKFNYGFLSGYSEEQFDKLEEYVVYPKIWAPYYTLHKILSGLIDCHEYAGSQKALDIAAKVGIWIYNRLSKLPEEQRQKMWAMYIAGEFGGINESLARLNKFTGKPEYIETAKFFDNEKLFYPMSINIDTLGGMHGNQHVPQIVGALEVFARTGEVYYYDIARNFWNIVTSSHIYNIGGLGEGEMFHDAHVIGNRLSDKTAESCCSYNMLKLTSKLFEYEQRAEYMDYFERTLYNHIAASQDQSGAVGGSTYFMPLNPGGKKGYDSRHNTCCHGTGLENHVKYQDAIYYLKNKSVYVNLYIPSVLDIEGMGSLAIDGDLLHTQKAVIKIIRSGFEELRLRIPNWACNFTLSYEYIVESGYIVIKNFKAGDIIEAKFKFKFRVEATKDVPEIVSLYYGPLVMVALDDSEKYVVLEKGFENKLQKTGGTDDLEFTLDGRKFVLNYYADTQKYHAYFKVM